MGCYDKTPQARGSETTGIHFSHFWTLHAKVKALADSVFWEPDSWIAHSDLLPVSSQGRQGEGALSGLSYACPAVWAIGGSLSLTAWCWEYGRLWVCFCVSFLRLPQPGWVKTAGACFTVQEATDPQLKVLGVVVASGGSQENSAPCFSPMSWRLPAGLPHFLSVVSALQNLVFTWAPSLCTCLCPLVSLQGSQSLDVGITPNPG